MRRFKRRVTGGELRLYVEYNPRPVFGVATPESPWPGFESRPFRIFLFFTSKFFCSFWRSFPPFFCFLLTRTTLAIVRIPRKAVTPHLPWHHRENICAVALCFRVRSLARALVRARGSLLQLVLPLTIFTRPLQYWLMFGLHVKLSFPSGSWLKCSREDKLYQHSCIHKCKCLNKHLALIVCKPSSASAKTTGMWTLLLYSVWTPPGDL